MGVAKIPVWAKMTPNVTHIEEPTAAAFRAGCQGGIAINTIRSVMGVNLETLRAEPTVEGCSTPGGYSSKAVKPDPQGASRSQAFEHWRRGNRSRRSSVHPSWGGCHSGLHRRHEVRLRQGEGSLRWAADVHGEQGLRDARRLQGPQSQMFHQPCRTRWHAAGPQGRGGGSPGADRHGQERCRVGR